METRLNIVSVVIYDYKITCKIKLCYEVENTKKSKIGMELRQKLANISEYENEQSLIKKNSIYNKNITPL